MIALLNENMQAVKVQAGVQGWFAISVDLLAISLVLLIVLICVIYRDFSTEPILLSMLLSYTVIIQSNLTTSLRNIMTL